MAYTTTTLEAFRTTLQRRWEDSVFWTAEEARLAINEALRGWNLLTGRWRETVTRNAIGNAPGVELVGSLVYGMRVKVGGGPALTPTSIVELDLGRPTWRLETVAGGGDIPTVPTLWAPISLQQIVIWPALSATVVNGVTIDGIAQTPVLVEDGDYVDAGEEVIDVLSDFALHIAAFKEGGPRWRRTRVYWQQFLQAAAEENGVLKTKQAYRRYAGLDRRRDLQKSKGVSTLMDKWQAERPTGDLGLGGS